MNTMSKTSSIAGSALERVALDQLRPVLEPRVGDVPAPRLALARVVLERENAAAEVPDAGGEPDRRVAPRAADLEHLAVRLRRDEREEELSRRRRDLARPQPRARRPRRAHGGPPPRAAQARRGCGRRAPREPNGSSSTYPGPVERAIVGYHRDEHGDWVAELACGHQQHVRHQPPFQLRPWVVEREGRRGRLGTPLECRLCGRIGRKLRVTCTHEIDATKSLEAVVAELVAIGFAAAPSRSARPTR